MAKIKIESAEITLITLNGNDYISLTDMAKSQYQEILIFKWLSLKSTIEYIGEWETLYNPIFNYTEFGIIKNEAGSNNFVLSTKNWCEKTNATGIVAKTGRYGGTYAHKDIAFHFGMWISAKFQLLLVREFQRLKEVENNKEQLEWNFQRYLSKVNYSIHTDAIKENIIPNLLDKTKTNFVYASEADVLNMALFGKTAKEWRDENLNTKGNIRDEATIEQLVVLSNLESLNAVFINQNLPQNERLIKLNEIAISQIKSLVNIKNVKQPQNKIINK